MKLGKLEIAIKDLGRAMDLYAKKDPVKNKAKIEYLREKIGIVREAIIIKKKQK